MTLDRDLDFQLATWLDERATSVMPDDLLARSLSRVATVRQRPAWLVGGVSVGRPVTLGRAALPAWVVAVVVGAAAVAVIAIGANLFTHVLVVAPSPSVQPTGTPNATPTPTASASPGPLGGGLILAHTYARFGDPGPLNVVAIDAGTRQITPLGTLPGKSGGGAGPYTFERSADRTRVAIFGQALEQPTLAAEPFEFTAIVAPGEWPQLSPDWNRVAGIRSDNFDNPIDIVVADLTGRVINRLPIPAATKGVGPLGWAPDGASLLVIGCRPCNKAETPTQKQTAHHAHIYIVPLDGSPWQELLDLDNGQINAQWSPDGTRLAVERYICAKGSFMPRCDPIEATSSLSVLTLADGVETRLGSTPGITGTAWSPDGTRIAYGDLDGAFVVDAATGATAKLADGQCFGAHWSPDGAWLIVDLSHGDSFTNYDIWIVRSDGSQLHQLVAGYAGASW